MAMLRIDEMPILRRRSSPQAAASSSSAGRAVEIMKAERSADENVAAIHRRQLGWPAAFELPPTMTFASRNFSIAGALAMRISPSLRWPSAATYEA